MSSSALNTTNHQSHQTVQTTDNRLTTRAGAAHGDGRGGEGVGGRQPAYRSGQAEAEEVEAEHLGVRGVGGVGKRSGVVLCGMEG